MGWLIKTWEEISDGKLFCIQDVNNARKAVDPGVDGIVKALWTASFWFSPFVLSGKNAKRTHLSL